MDPKSNGREQMHVSRAAIAAAFAAVLSAVPAAAQEDPIVFGGASNIAV